MKEKIGEIAGRIWKALREKEEFTVQQLTKILKEEQEIIYMALGWLAREDKINSKKRRGKIYFSLSQSERNVK
ncbi:winged helix-turn-helix domain-containing protein [candidate division KSB1 bacterium]